jgi:ABC-type protease/lipase transport system fused ATPase/permease subunit
VALANAIMDVRERGGIAIIIAHRANALASVDHVLILNQGRQSAFGPRDEVLRTGTCSTPLAVIPKKAEAPKMAEAS